MIQLTNNPCAVNATHARHAGMVACAFECMRRDLTWPDVCQPPCNPLRLVVAPLPFFPPMKRHRSKDKPTILTHRPCRPQSKPSSPLPRQLAVAPVLDGPELGIERCLAPQPKPRRGIRHSASFLHHHPTESVVQFRPVQCTQFTGNDPFCLRRQPPVADDTMPGQQNAQPRSNHALNLRTTHSGPGGNSPP